jgi:hypothetical protein
MQDDSELFNVVMLQHGGRLRSERVSEQNCRSYEAVLALLRNRSQDLLQAACAMKLMPNPELYVDLIDSWTTNAYVVRVSKSRYQIGITWGAVSEMSALLTQMFRSPEFLPFVGNADKEERKGPLSVHPNGRFVPSAGDFGTKMTWKKPKDATRRAYLDYTIRLMLEFVLRHEIAHIVLNHLDENDKQIAEYTTQRKSQISQKCEIEADELAGLLMGAVCGAIARSTPVEQSSFAFPCSLIAVSTFLFLFAKR